MTEERVHKRSVSQFGTWSKCGEAFRLEKIAHAPQRQAAWFAQGHAVHEAIELYESTGREANADQVAQWFERRWSAEIEAAKEREPNIENWMTGGRTKPANDIAARHERGLSQALAYMDYVRDAPERILEIVEGEFAVEVPFEIELGGVIVRGYIDQVIVYPDGGFKVRDIKAGNKIPDSTFQLGVYNIAVRRLFGINAGWGDYFMCKNNAPQPAADLSRFTEERVGRWFANMQKAVSLGLFAPNVGDHCRVCLVADFCDATGRRSDEFPAPTPVPERTREGDWQYG